MRLSAYYDEVIEIGILRVRDNTIVDRYSQLIHPSMRSVSHNCINWHYK